MSAVRIAPSVLSADFSKLTEHIRLVEAAGADWLHVDVMDGHFVPNLTFGPHVVEGLRGLTKLYLDTHLMVEEPARFVSGFARAGSGGLTIHVEVPGVQKTLRAIRDLGLRAGLAVKPGTPLQSAEPYLSQIDLLLIMTVEPGFGGQSLIEGTLAKLAAAQGLRESGGFEWDLEVDGGINAGTTPDVTRRGADVLVAGNSIFGEPDPAAALRAIRAAIEM
jgi:ribulose-phosphate 3-epimerase